MTVTSTPAGRENEVEPSAHILAQIVDWNWDYNLFRANRPLTDEHAALWENRVIRVVGLIQAPTPLVGRTLHLNLALSDRYAERALADREPVGRVVHMPERVVNCFARLPTDVGPMLLQMLLSRAYRWVRVMAAPWDGARADANGYHFYRERPADD
jgi:hypothetical protein